MENLKKANKLKNEIYDKGFFRTTKGNIEFDEIVGNCGHYTITIRTAPKYWFTAIEKQRLIAFLKKKGIKKFHNKHRDYIFFDMP